MFGVVTYPVQPVNIIRERLAQFNVYARMGPRTLGIDPELVRVELDR